MTPQAGGLDAAVDLVVQSMPDQFYGLLTDVDAYTGAGDAASDGVVYGGVEPFPAGGACGGCSFQVVSALGEFRPYLCSAGGGGGVIHRLRRRGFSGVFGRCGVPRMLSIRLSRWVWVSDTG